MVIMSEPVALAVLSKIQLEQADLEGRLERLTTFLESQKNTELLSVKHQALLYEQKRAMTQYNDILIRRIEELKTNE